MLNQLVMVGRLTKKAELKKDENGKSYTNITLAIPRSYKNEEGIYDTDFINVSLFNGVAENVSEWVNKGDLLGIKGRLETRPKTNDEDFQNGREMVVIADKVTFLSSKRPEERKEENGDE